MPKIPYWNYKIEPGEYIDPEQRFIYIRDAKPSKSGYRRAIVQEAETGDILEFSFTTLRTNSAKTPAEKEFNRKKANQKKAQYHAGDIIGKYKDILILDLDPEKYPPKQRTGNKQDRCGLFKNLITGEEFVATLNSAIMRSSSKISSLGEARISQILTEYDIPFKAQKRYDSLPGFSGGKSLAFDFYLPNDDVLIEYDGPQHLLSFHDSTMFKTDVQSNYMSYARDIMKEAWCYANHIPLVRLSNVPVAKMDYDLIADLIHKVREQSKHGEYLLIYPEDNKREYESVSVTMSHLDARYQYDFYRCLRDTDISYRRANDKPLNEDEELLRALPSDNSLLYCSAIQSREVSIGRREYRLS